MRMILFILLLAPSLVFAQQAENKDPLTPYADISFRDDLVVYTLARSTTLNNPRLLPRVYDKRLLRLEFSNTFPDISGKYIAMSFLSIRDYMDTELITLRSSAEQLEYLKLCALLVILENQLSKHALSELSKIVDSGNNQLAINAEQVIGLHEFYKENTFSGEE